MSLVDLKFENRVAFIEMRNAKHLNCLSEELCNDMTEAIKKASSFDDICAMVVKAEDNVKVWSAGHDIKDLPLNEKDPLGYHVPMEGLLRAAENAPVPVIALVTGSVWGGACDFCVSCDMIVADENSTFAITPAKLGIPYNVSGITHFINAMGVNRAKEMFFTAAPITAKEAFNLGLANHIAPREKLMEVLEELILNPMRKNSVLSIACIKKQFRVLGVNSVHLNPELFEMTNALRSIVYESADYKEGIKSFLEKRAPNFKGKASDVKVKI